MSGKLVTSAASFGRRGHRHRPHDRLASRKRDHRRQRQQQDRHAGRAPRTRPPRRSSSKYTTLAAPLANRVDRHGHAPTSSSARGTPSGQNAAGEQPMGDVIADAQLAATTASDFGSAVAAFMNAGRRPRQPVLARSAAASTGRGHLRRGVHRPAVRQHPRDQDAARASSSTTCSTSQFNNPAAGLEPDHAAVGERALHVDDDGTTHGRATGPRHVRRRGRRTRPRRTASP